MPATETVKTLAASFDGVGGALALSLIAFSVVFLVLAGLTCVIFVMRYVTKIGQKTSEPKAEAAKAGGASVSSASASASDEDELVAVIAAAIFAQTGENVVINSITPVSGRLIDSGVDGWIACGRVESLQGALVDRW